MQNTTAFVKKIKKWTPEKLYAEKLAVQAKKKDLETKRRDIQAQIDALAIQLDALYTINSGFDIENTSDYKARLHVTDHAIIRYIDRVLKVDTDDFRKELIKSLPNTVPRNASTVVANNITYQLTWLPDQIILKTLYKRRRKKKETKEVTENA